MLGRYPGMSTFLTDVRLTVAPPRDGRDARLPPLLVAVTGVAGLIAFSYLVPGHVFVASVTGNVAFLALAGAPLMLPARIVFPLVIALLILVAVAIAGGGTPQEHAV